MSDVCSNTLHSGSCLFTFDNTWSSWNSLSSSNLNGIYTAHLGFDGNIGVWAPGLGGPQLQSSANTNGLGQPPYKLSLDFRANLSLWSLNNPNADPGDPANWGQPLWTAPLQAPLQLSLPSPFILVMQDDANLVLMEANSHPVWNTGSNPLVPMGVQ